MTSVQTTKIGKAAVRDAEAEMGMVAKAGPFGQTLVEAARQRPDIAAVSADLKKYTDLTAFAQMFPERYVEVGMAEQNLVCVAAGLAKSGLTVVATSFAAFLSRRTLDFIVMQVALPRARVILVGATPGVSATFGPSHTTVEDLAMMRAVPNLTVLDPTDPQEAAEALAWALECDGPVYLRQPFNRASTQRPEGQVLPPFEVGRAHVVREGEDLTMVVTGDRLQSALRAAESLARDHGVESAVIRATSVKPFDDETVAHWAHRTGRVLTVENHSLHGGLFSTVCEVVAARAIAARVAGNGVKDVFPPFGTPGHVPVVLGMTDADVVADALALMEK